MKEKSKQEVASEAYQVIGSLADSARMFDKEKVQEALTYFSDIANDTPSKKGILPWVCE